MKEQLELFLEIENHEPAHAYWARAIRPFILEEDNLETIRKCLMSRTWTDNQARLMHRIACRKFDDGMEASNDQ